MSWLDEIDFEDINRKVKIDAIKDKFSQMSEQLAKQQEEIDEPVYGISMFSCGCIEEVGSQLTKKQAEEWCKELNQSNDDYLDKSFFVSYDYHLSKHNKGE